jgi:hypothetical protein
MTDASLGVEPAGRFARRWLSENETPKKGAAIAGGPKG